MDTDSGNKTRLTIGLFAYAIGMMKTPNEWTHRLILILNSNFSHIVMGREINDEQGNNLTGYLNIPSFQNPFQINIRNSHVLIKRLAYDLKKATTPKGI